MNAFQESNTITDKEESESKHQNQKNIFDRYRDHAPLIVWVFFFINRAYWMKQASETADLTT